MLQNIYNWLNDLIKPVRDFIFEHYDSPIFWIILFLIGILIFKLTASALEKRN